ncbi:MAG: cell division FtsA domain-containing protein [Deltaproteobacteria bacterium]|nr:cell division FtsA domain-containing protein [Deltaproteobacteria bacterium]
MELANVMKLGVFQPEGAYALLDVGHEKTNVLIFVGSELQFARTIMIGGKDLSQAIADLLNIPFIEAERMKIELGQVGPDLEGADQTTKTISTALKSILSELCLNLKQTFMAFQQTKGELVQALVLCGGTSRLAGIDHYLSTELRKNVSFLDCLDFPFNQLADSNWCRPIAASALALAYRGVLGSGVRDIQFRRGEFAYKGEVKAITGFTKQVAVLMVVTALFMIGSFVTSYVSLKGRSKRQITQIQTMATQILPDLPKKTLSNPSAILSTLSGKVNEAEEKKKKIEEEASLSVMEILKQFSLALPKREQIQVDVDDLTIMENRIRIQGKTVSFEGVDQIKAALSQSKYFKNVATDNVKKGFKDDVRFSLSLEVAEGGQGG